MKYSKEFKEEALKLSDEIGLKKAAQQLGIQYYTLSDWCTLGFYRSNICNISHTESPFNTQGYHTLLGIGIIKGNKCGGSHLCKPLICFFRLLLLDKTISISYNLLYTVRLLDSRWITVR